MERCGKTNLDATLASEQSISIKEVLTLIILVVMTCVKNVKQGYGNILIQIAMKARTKILVWIGSFISSIALWMLFIWGTMALLNWITRNIEAWLV